MGEDKDVVFVREQLRKASQVKDPRQMWYAVRDIFDLLTMLIVEPSKKEEEAAYEGVFIEPG